jgi:hypothetical protein
MNAKAVMIGLLTAAAAFSQTGAAGITNSAVSGTVKDTGTGEPLENYTVSTSVHVTWVGNAVVQSADTKDVKTTTDAHGHYRLGDLPPGEYRIKAGNAPGSGKTKHLVLAGQDLDNIDFNIAVDGTISGKVIDENKEPVSGLTVYLVSKEYYLGSVGYYPKSTARTDDRGEYILRRVAAGHPYLIMADKREQRLPAYSEAPVNPKLRRPVPMRTWYPNSPSKDSAQSVVIRSGEHRERVDIEIKKSPCYCVDGTLVASNGAALLTFTVEALSPSSGTSSGGGTFLALPTSKTGPDGKFRLCDLYPGVFRMTVIENGEPPNYGVASITVSDKDLHDLKIATVPGMPLEGEVVWDGAAPEKPVPQKVQVYLAPLLRTQLPGEKAFVRAEIPSTFSYSGLLMDEYSVGTFLNAPGLYVKDVTYSGRGVMYERLSLGGAMGNAGLRVSVAHDGAKLSVRVSDQNSNPAPDMKVVLLPADIRSEGMLASVMVAGQTNQLGQYTSVTLAPGKYYVFASPDDYDATVESIGKLWRSRNRFTEVELPPNGTAQVSLMPVKLE